MKTKEEMGKTNYFKNLEGEFVMIPNEIAKCPNISLAAFRLLPYLAINDEIFPGYKNIQKHTGMSRGTISKALEELEKRKIIIQVKKGYSYGT